MNVKSILRRVWKESKLGFLNLLYSLVLTVVFSTLKLGNNLLAYPRSQMEGTVRTKFEPTAEEFRELEWFAAYAIKIFQYESVELLRKDYEGYVALSDSTTREAV